MELCIRAQNGLSSADVASNPLLQELSSKLARKSEMLTTKLVSELFAPEGSRSDRRRLCRLLSGLGHEEQARLLYLSRASDEIANHHRLVKPCGDLPSLVAGLSEQFFECLQDTAVNFDVLFCKETPSLYAIFLAWASSEIEAFVRQVVVYVGTGRRMQRRRSARKKSPWTRAPSRTSPAAWRRSSAAWLRWRTWAATWSAT